MGLEQLIPGYQNPEQRSEVDSFKEKLRQRGLAGSVLAFSGDLQKPYSEAIDKFAPSAKAAISAYFGAGFSPDNPISSKAIPPEVAEKAASNEPAGPPGEDIFRTPEKGQMGPTKEELLDEPQGSRVNLTVNGKTYDYRGAGRGLPLGRTLPPGKGSFSQAAVTGTGAEKYAQEDFQTKMNQLNREASLGKATEATRLATLSPEQRLLEQRKQEANEVEAIVGNEADFVGQRVKDAQTQMASDPRFAALSPEQKQATMAAKVSSAVQQAREEYQARRLQAYIKRFPTQPTF